MTVLVTGGAGYIGSHIVVELQNAGYHVVVVDNLSNSCMEVLNRVKRITGQDVSFYQVDVRDRQALSAVFDKERIKCCIHLAGLKSVAESVLQPWAYYDNNVSGSLVLLDVMRRHDVKNIVFSSSATVYGIPKTMPINESCPHGQITNPYARTKGMIEQILKDTYVADETWSIAVLRYFNPIGAHKSGLIGEAPSGTPNNLMPYITQVAVGKLPYLNIWGNDYDTTDGTGIRDYIHVLDLAGGHVVALDYLKQKKGFDVFNLGTGRGCSVLELVKTFEAVSSVPIPYQIKERRAGDVAVCYADTTKAKTILGWEAKRGIPEMCEDAWRWQQNNPDGY